MRQFIKIPNKFIGKDNKLLEIIWVVLYNQNYHGTTIINANWLLNQSLLTCDRKKLNLKLIMDYFNLKDANEIKCINIDSLYSHNNLGKHKDYTIVYIDEYNKINNIKLFGYFCYLLKNKGTFMTITQIQENYGISRKTIVDYNNKLVQLKCIEYYNEYDLETKRRTVNKYRRYGE